MIAVVGAVVVVTAVGVIALVPQRRHATSGRSSPTVDRRDARFASWGLQALDAMGYTCWCPASLIWPGGRSSAPTAEWLDAQLVLASRENTTLVLDCLVLPSNVDDLDSWYCGTPITLRAHPTAGLTSVADIGCAVARWVDTGSTVGIALEERDGMAMLSIADDGAMVVLELEAASA